MPRVSWNSAGGLSTRLSSNPSWTERRELPRSEIRSALEALGFRLVRDRRILEADMETPDGKAVVCDLHEQNVFGLQEGSIAVINCDIRAKEGTFTASDAARSEPDRNRPGHHVQRNGGNGECSLGGLACIFAPSNSTGFLPGHVECSPKGAVFRPSRRRQSTRSRKIGPEELCRFLEFRSLGGRIVLKTPRLQNSPQRKQPACELTEKQAIFSCFLCVALRSFATPKASFQSSFSQP
jgi:hypothetical protein